MEKKMPYPIPGPHWDVFRKNGFYVNVYPKDNDELYGKNKTDHGSLVTIIYDKVTFFHIHSERLFYCWLSQIPSIEKIEWFNSSEDHVYINPTKIDYNQMLSLLGIFIIYKVKGREQLEKLLQYLPEEDALNFEKYFLIPWRKRKRKKK